MIRSEWNCSLSPSLSHTQHKQGLVKKEAQKRDKTKSSLSENEQQKTSSTKELSLFSKELEALSLSLEKAEKELDDVYQSLAGKTSGFKEKMEERERCLLPVDKKICDIESAIKVLSLSLSDVFYLSLFLSNILSLSINYE